MGITSPRRWQGLSHKGHMLKSLDYTSINRQTDKHCKQWNIDKTRLNPEIFM